jgi:hypothetical protein
MKDEENTRMAALILHNPSLILLSLLYFSSLCTETERSSGVYPTEDMARDLHATANISRGPHATEKDVEPE